MQFTASLTEQILYPTSPPPPPKKRCTPPPFQKGPISLSAPHSESLDRIYEGEKININLAPSPLPFPPPPKKKPHLNFSPLPLQIWPLSLPLLCEKKTARVFTRWGCCQLQHLVHQLPQAGLLGELVVHQVHQAVVVMNGINHLARPRPLLVQTTPRLLPQGKRFVLKIQRVPLSCWSFYYAQQWPNASLCTVWMRYFYLTLLSNASPCTVWMRYFYLTLLSNTSPCTVWMRYFYLTLLSNTSPCTVWMRDFYLTFRSNASPCTVWMRDFYLTLFSNASPCTVWMRDFYLTLCSNASPCTVWMRCFRDHVKLSNHHVQQSLTVYCVDEVLLSDLAKQSFTICCVDETLLRQCWTFITLFSKASQSTVGIKHLWDNVKLPSPCLAKLHDQLPGRDTSETKLNFHHLV